MFDNQGESGVGNGSQRVLGNNIVHEGNLLADGEELAGEMQTAPQQFGTNDFSSKINDDNSFHMDKCIEKIHENPRFSQKEKEFSQRIDNFIKSKTGKSISNFTNYIFIVNKILLLTTFTEFLFQRCDIITMFLSLVIILIELGIFSHKHIYKWLLVLIASILFDALVLLDISPVS